MNFTLEADELVALPLDELALMVLRDADTNGEWNWRNWLISAQRGYPKRPDVHLALSEAWGWISRKGLITYDPSQSSEAAFKISRSGRELLSSGLPWLRAVERLDIDLVPVLEQKARPQFLRGDFENAVFIAMREVEIQVRQKASFGNDKYGVALMTEAFKQGGPLAQHGGVAGEVVATMNLFQGAFGLFKNPSSHRQVTFSDPTEAAEVVLLADLLLRLLAKI